MNKDKYKTDIKPKKMNGSKESYVESKEMKRGDKKHLFNEIIELANAHIASTDKKSDKNTKKTSGPSKTETSKQSRVNVHHPVKKVASNSISQQSKEYATNDMLVLQPINIGKNGQSESNKVADLIIKFEANDQNTIYDRSPVSIQSSIDEICHFSSDEDVESQAPINTNVTIISKIRNIKKSTIITTFNVIFILIMILVPSLMINFAFRHIIYVNQYVVAFNILFLIAFIVLLFGSLETVGDLIHEYIATIYLFFTAILYITINMCLYFEVFFSNKTN